MNDVRQTGGTQNKITEKNLDFNHHKMFKRHTQDAEASFGVSFDRLDNNAVHHTVKRRTTAKNSNIELSNSSVSASACAHEIEDRQSS